MGFKGHKAFKEGRENVEDDHRSGRPISSTNDQNVEMVRAVIAKDRRLSVRLIAGQTVKHVVFWFPYNAACNNEHSKRV